MQLFKFLWTTHKWTGIVLAVVFLNIAITGILLLLKKDYEWIQPPTKRGAPGAVAEFITTEKLFEVVLAADDPDFRTIDDIDRVDFRPGKRVHKVRSVRNDAEIQVDAVTGAILSRDMRRSDWIERLHDGSLFGEWFHGWVMPVVALSLAFLVCSGLFIWYYPIHRKRKRQRQADQADRADQVRPGAVD